MLKRDLGRIGLLLLAGVALSCRASGPESTGASGGPAAGAACAVDDGAIRRWIQQPSLPSDPVGTDTACFWSFAWQELFDVAQVQGGIPQLATWPNDQELFPASGAPPPWRTAPHRMRVRLLRKGLGLPGSGGVTPDQVAEAAALTPVVDQRGRWAHYSIVVDSKEYDYVRCCELYQGGCFNQQGGVATSPAGVSQIQLPTGSLELKLAWRVLETCHLPDSPTPCTPEDASRFLTVQGDVQPYSPSLPRVENVTLGLVGVHIVQRTPQHTGSIWATFEHRDNDPDCPPAGGASPPGAWQFYNPACDPKDPHCQPNAYCPPEPIKVPAAVAQAFNAKYPGDKDKDRRIPIAPDGEGILVCTAFPNDFNQPVTLKDGKQVWIHLFDPASKAPPIPTQVCRSTPIDPQVNALNDQVRRVLGQLGGGTGVFAHYQLVGVLWSNGPKDVEPAGATPPLLANTTMETYLQPLPTGCLACHADQVNGVPSQPPMQYNSGLANRSFLFQQIRQFGGTCSANQAAKCSAWAQGCPVS